MAPIEWLCVTALVLASNLQAWSPGNTRALIRSLRQAADNPRRSTSGAGHAGPGKKDGGPRSPTDRAQRVLRQAAGPPPYPGFEVPPGYPGSGGDWVAPDNVDVIMVPITVGLNGMIPRLVARTIEMFSRAPGSNKHTFNDNTVNTIPECTANLQPGMLCVITVQSSTTPFTAATAPTDINTPSSADQPSMEPRAPTNPLAESL
ncbi:uncharacterized protein LOC134529805 isoform X2 [Bacillus rossius redtenbacheri]|uniref:uncharacterized protein LOC134529805 isoform X2 n=1 Tax=Bacillus rossius redtenbacheri TaxID=93214 RepID=UPI002FDE82B2